MVEFFQMGGYAWFVWPSYAITGLVLWINWYLPRRELKHQLNFLRRRKGRLAE